MTPEERAERALQKIISITRDNESWRGSINIVANEIRGAVREEQEACINIMEKSGGLIGYAVSTIRARGKKE